MKIAVQTQAFDLGAEASALAAGHRDMGAVVTFTGVVRDLARGDLDRMVIEHYPGMTQKAIEEIAGEAQRRWNLGDVLVIHRYGDLAPGEMIMMVGT
ncbi:MAG: molybdenum cofactor biosynthesis protein MoaE, partial [Shimia sp.]|nr:molybdenum cofactor biosynthesis protein MoaE [Shimia sp.]